MHRPTPVRPLRVAILSDTHNFLDPRIEALVAGCDYAVHAGDIGGVGVLDALRPRLGVVVAVRGNNDTPQQWVAEEREALLRIPQEAHLALPGGELAVLHGDHLWPTARLHQRLRAAHPGVRLVVYGHSHTKVVDRLARPWVINPGAAGRRLTRGGPSCLVVTAAVDHWRVEGHRFPPLVEETAMAG